MEQYIVLGYEFEDKETAEIAKNEMEMISKIKSQGNMNNHKIALSVYNKLVDDNLFQTQVGIEYMRTLQKELLAANDIDNNAVKPMRVVSGQQNTTKDDEKEFMEYRKRINQNRTKENEKKYKDRFVKSLIVNVVFGVVIAAMFLIVKMSDRFDVQAHRESVENDYISWEKDLDERESSIMQWEEEHGTDSQN